MAKTRLQQRRSKVDPTYYLSNQGTGYTSLWKLITTAPSTADTTTSVVFPKGSTGYMKVIPGTQNKTILSDLPTTFDKYGWRTDTTLRGKFDAGSWTFSVAIRTGKYVTGNITVYVRLWKSSNPDGSNATALTGWLTIGTLTGLSANTRYVVKGQLDISEIVLVDEYLFVEYALGTTSACGSSTGCTVTFECNYYVDEYIATTAYTNLYFINLNSVQDTGETSNKGTITFDGVEYTLPNTILKPAGTYVAQYNPVLPYPFVKWQVSGGISVSDPFANPTNVTVSDDGTLTAVYRYQVYKIVGICIDENGNPIPGAELHLFKLPDHVHEAQTTCQSDGTYSFTNLIDQSKRYIVAWKETDTKKVGTTDYITPEPQ